MINIKVGKKLTIKESTSYVDSEHLRTAINFLQDRLAELESYQDSLMFEEDVATNEEATKGVDVSSTHVSPRHLCEILNHIHDQTAKRAEQALNEDDVTLIDLLASFKDPRVSVRSMHENDGLSTPEELDTTDKIRNIPPASWEPEATKTPEPPKPQPLVFHHFITDFSQIDVDTALNEVVQGNEVPVNTACFSSPTRDFVKEYRSELAPIWWVCIILQHSEGVKIIAPGEKFEYTVNNSGQIVLV